MNLSIKLYKWGIWEDNLWSHRSSQIIKLLASLPVLKQEKSTASREDAQHLYPSHQKPTKNPSPTYMLEIPSGLLEMITCRKYLLSKWESSAGAHSKAKADFTSRTRGSEWETRSCATNHRWQFSLFPCFRSLLLPAATHTAVFCTARQSLTFPLSSIPPHMNTATV